MVSKVSDHVAMAVVPDQLAGYVQAVSGLQSMALGRCLLHYVDKTAVLVAYSVKADRNIWDEGVEQVLGLNKFEQITVLAPEVPSLAPADAHISRDNYWFLPIPAPAPGQKLRNMLKRAQKDVTIFINGSEAYACAHKEMVDAFCNRKAAVLSDGSRYIFSNLDKYLAACPDALLFTARNDLNEAVAMAIGDFSALGTAFYMFAFRHENAPPGTSDLLLAAVLDEAARRGHTRINLGLGMGKGVEFFKKKWGAEPALAYVETSWEIKRARKGWFSRLFG